MYREQLDTVAKMRREVTKTVEYKRKRLVTKQKRSSKNCANQNKEGIFYLSASGFEGVSELIKDLLATGHENFENAQVVVFDLATSGLGRDTEICQIAAVNGESSFNVYTVPAKRITPQASAVTGLQVVNGEMFSNDKRLNTVPTRLALLQFVEFLRSFRHEILLVAHNGFRFDVPIILRQMRKNDLLNEFMSVVNRFNCSVFVTISSTGEKLKKN